MRKLEIMLLSQLHDIGPSTQARLVDASRDTDWLEVVLTLSELIEEGYIKPFAYQGEEIPEEGIQRNTPLRISPVGSRALEEYRTQQHEKKMEKIRTWGMLIVAAASFLLSFFNLLRVLL